MKLPAFATLSVLSLGLVLAATLFGPVLAQDSQPSATPAPSSPAPAPTATPAAPATPAPSPAPPVQPPPPQPSVAAPTAIGGLAGMNAYTTCGYLGELADGLTRGRDPLEIEQRAAALARGLIVNMRQLEAVGAEGGLTPQADAQLASLRRLLGALGEQARALELYALTQEETIAATFRELRRRTWTESARLLGLSPAAAKNLAPGGADLGVPPAPSPTPAAPTPTPSTAPATPTPKGE